jgi:hypothetical protein
MDIIRFKRTCTCFTRNMLAVPSFISSIMVAFSFKRSLLSLLHGNLRVNVILATVAEHHPAAIIVWDLDACGVMSLVCFQGATTLPLDHWEALGFRLIREKTIMGYHSSFFNGRRHLRPYVSIKSFRRPSEGYS